MTKGHELAIAGERIGDHSKNDDVNFAIWGQTKGLGERAQINLVLSHFFARTFSAAFINDPDKKLHAMLTANDSKDALLRAMAEVLMMQAAQNIAPLRVLKMWGAAKKDGGLGWIPKERQDMFNLAFAKK
jgi:hypothetical protein